MNDRHKLSMMMACLFLCAACTKESLPAGKYNGTLPQQPASSEPRLNPGSASDSGPSSGTGSRSGTTAAQISQALSESLSTSGKANFINISKTAPVKDSGNALEQSMMKAMGEPIAFADDVIFKVHPIHIESWKPGMPLDMILEISEKFPEPAPVPQFLIQHEKLAHMFLVSKDMSVFQHLHPDLERPGLMRQMTESISKGGEYLVFLQFTTAQRGERTVVQKLHLPGSSEQAKLTQNWNKPVFLDGYRFELKDCPLTTGKMYMPEIEITRHGQTVNYIQPFLGAGAHGLILNDKMTQFIHVHPVTEAQSGLYASPIMFHTKLFKAGIYRFWAQFMIEGKFYAVPFTFKVSE